MDFPSESMYNRTGYISRRIAEAIVDQGGK